MEKDGYAIRIREELSPEWALWFDDMAFGTSREGHTIITGHVVDQAALHGLLARIRDLNLTLLSVERVNLHSSASEDGNS